MCADMTLQTASGSTHEGEERAVSINNNAKEIWAIPNAVVDIIVVLVRGLRPRMMASVGRDCGKREEV